MAESHSIHAGRVGQTRPAIIRYLEKIIVSENRFFEGSPCWEWIGSTNPKTGYGEFKIDGRRNTNVPRSSPHRFAHEYFIGEIPAGYEVDHRCENRICANPLHLEAITLEENRRRRNPGYTHCKWGHPIETGIYCRACRRWRTTLSHAHSGSANIKEGDRLAAQKRLGKMVAYGEIPLEFLGRHAHLYAYLFTEKKVA